MRAIVCPSAPVLPGELVYDTNHPKPQPKDGSVLIQVKAFGLNRSELFTRQGHSPGIQFPRILGIECVGVVEDAGGGPWRKGDSVAAIMGGMGRQFDGGYAEYCLVPHASVTPPVKLPDGMGWAQFAAIPETFLTAWGTLSQSLNLQPDDTLLIRGGTTSVGLACATLARSSLFNCSKVISTTRSSRKTVTITASGATDVVVDSTGTIHEAIKDLTDGSGASKCVELVGGTTLFDSCQSLSPSGVISMIGCVSGEWVCKEFDPMTALAPSKHLTMFGSGTIDVTKSPMQWLVDAASREEIQLNLDRVFKLEEAGAAHAYMESNAAAGKVYLFHGVPDEQIFPHATGLAAETVAKHQEPQELIFYSGWFCPFVQRSWLTLEEKGIPYQYKEVNPYKKEQHFLEINPKGLVPAIEYKGKALYESLILCELFEEAFPDHKPNLLPADPIGRAQARLAFDHISKNFIPAYFRLLISQTKDKQEAALEEVNEALRTFSAKIKGPYYFGEEFSLVDIAIAPWIVRDYIVIEHRGFKREVVGDVWKQYAELVEKRDSVLRTSSDKQHYTEIYGRYLRDEAQSAAAIAIRQGKAVP